MSVTTHAARTVRLDGPARPALVPFGAFPRDPTNRWARRTFAKAVRTPEGPGSVAFTWSGRAGGEIDVEAWGEGSGWLLDAAPRWLGMHDDPSSFDPSANARLADLWRRHGPLRIGATGVVWQHLLFTIVGQRVTVQEAVRAWREMLEAWGERAPGPLGLMLVPSPEIVASKSYVEFHRFGIERSRATTMIAAARCARRLERVASMSIADALRRLMAVPGIGPWTATSTLAATLGDPDVIVEGDYGLPTMVCWAFTGDATRQRDDARMFELLEPFRPHRQRVVRLLFAAGASPPRRAPRARNPRIAWL